MLPSAFSALFSHALAILRLQWLYITNGQAGRQAGRHTDRQTRTTSSLPKINYKTTLIHARPYVKHSHTRFYINLSFLCSEVTELSHAAETRFEQGLSPESS